MIVSKLIEILKEMPQDAPIAYIYNGRLYSLTKFKACSGFEGNKTLVVFDIGSAKDICAVVSKFGEEFINDDKNYW